jgi:two-component system, sensor histidine kinase and response regulator
MVMEMGISEYNTNPRPEVFMHKPRRAQVMAYGVALLAIGVSLIVRLALVPWLGYHAELMTFLPVIVISAYLGGLGPGLLATVLSAAVGDYFFIDPRFSLAISSLGSVRAMGLFLFVGAMISGLMESLHRSGRRSIDEEERLRTQQAVHEAEQRFRQVAREHHRTEECRGADAPRQRAPGVGAARIECRRLGQPHA